MLQKQQRSLPGERSSRLCTARWCPSIGLSLTGGFAVQPEQSTLAIVAHHPQAVYFGMKSGFLPEKKAPDDIIAGSDRAATLRRGHRDPRGSARGRARARCDAQA